MSLWDDITEEDLRTAAKVAKASGGFTMAAAADAWLLRADLMQELDLRDQLRSWVNNT